MSDKVKKKSPIKEKPLRNPGQSLDEQLEELVNEKLFFYLMLGVIVIVYTLIEWFQYWSDAPPSPYIVTFGSIIVLIYCGVRGYQTWKKIKPIKQGLEGERSVGQELEKLRAQGCHVYHDIPAGNFNIDHVVVSTKGIFAIETKTYSKPARGQANVTFDGKALKVNGYTPERDPVAQASWNAKWVKELLQGMTGKSYPVKPVVVFPGWYIKQIGSNTFKEIWVLNPKGLPKFIAQESEVIAPEDVLLAMNRLELHVRGFKD